MVNHLPGNPYADYAQQHMDPALATLALAHEQRTEALIAWRDRLLNMGNEIQAADVGGIINERLGLNGGTNG